jgi:hypothetical protein
MSINDFFFPSLQWQQQIKRIELFIILFKIASLFTTHIYELEF